MDRFVVREEKGMFYIFDKSTNDKISDYTYFYKSSAEQVCRLLNTRPDGTPEFTPPPMPSIKPPLAVKPRWIHEEHRMAALQEAFNRFMDVYHEIPQEWLDEYNELAKRKAGK